MIRGFEEGMQEQSIILRAYQPNDSNHFWRMISDFRFDLEREYYERCIERHNFGELMIVLYLENGRAIGFALLNWQPKYSLFKRLGIPEIQDLNVLSSYRRQGIGRQIIHFCENLATEKGHDTMGIGVGLDSTFGAAQRLYISMKYIPDGNGVCYDRMQVSKGEFKPIDENLSLMMTKTLKN